MKQSTGLSKDETVAFARTITPPGIDVDAVESSLGAVLILKLNFGVGTSRCLIHNSSYDERNTGEDAEIERIIAEKTKLEITKNVQKYRDDYFGMVSQKLGLEGRLKRDDELYCINRFYEYEVAPGFSQRENLDLYYSERMKRDMPSFEKVWQSLAYGNFAHVHSEELFEYLHGVMERYKQALFAEDLIAKLLKRKTDNDIVFLVNFHFYYFITVIKALGDCLAWILNYFYSLNLESSPSQIDLTKTGFREKLLCANERLFKKVCQGSLYEKFNKLTEFRDIVVHRHALHVVTVQLGQKGESKIMVPIDPYEGTMVNDWTRQKVQRGHVINKKLVAEYGLKQLMVYVGSGGNHLGYSDVLDYCNTHLSFIRESFDKTFEVMSGKIEKTSAIEEK